jgi:hypothetical protein
MVDFANAYVQENDLLSELLGEDQDVYKKTYYESDGYDGEKVKNLYAYTDADGARDDDLDGYGSVDEAESSGDELPIIPSNGYSEAADLLLDDANEGDEPQIGYSYGTQAEGDNYADDSELAQIQNSNNVNLKASVGLARAVSVPVVRLEEEIKEGFEKKDWNKAFQTILALPESESKYQKLSQLAHEFIFVAETYGKVIISEINVPVEHKTIKPISIGGQAGGEKYIAQGILFKFALDVGNLYGGNDEYAQKAAGHDLKGLINYSLASIPGLHFPLMSLIHYMGYCLIAMSLLPIGKDSLKYGSADAGKTMHFDVPAINEKMKQAGEALNLKGHIAGFAKYQVNLCYGPGDIECHLGKDGKFYVLDFARTFPPEAILPGTTPQKGQILFKLLRPELVKSNPVPLSSDSFTGFGMGDPAHKTHNREVAEATDRLLTKVIPELAKKILKEEPRSDGSCITLSVLDGSLITEIHKEGINVRHMGYLRRKLGEDSTASRAILVEMIARIVKSKLKKQWRAITKVNQHITEEQCKQVTVIMLNNLYSDSESANKYWTQKMPRYLKKKFKYALFKSEKGQDLRQVLSYHGNGKELLARVQQLTGIVLSATAIADTEDFKQMTFVHSDIERINATVKNMHIVELADTQLLLWNGIRSSGREAERILSLASKKLEQNSLMSLHLTKILKLVYQLYQKTKKVQSETSMALAMKLLDVVIRVQPKTEMAYLLYSKVLFHTSDVFKMEMIKKFAEGLNHMPDSALLHAEKLKKRVQMIIRDRNDVTTDTLTEMTKHYEYAIRESYLKGTASMYYALLLFFGAPERMEEAVQLMAEGSKLTPQKFESVLKFLLHRVLPTTFHPAISYKVITAVQPLVPKNLYHVFDEVKIIATGNDLTNVALGIAKESFAKVSQIILNKTEEISTSAVLELIKARVDTLERLELSEFEDLPQELVESLQKCQALTRLQLKDTNLTLKDVINVLEFVKVKILSVPAISEMTPDSLTKMLSFSNIQDLNISKAALSREDMATLLDNANVTRLFLNQIESLDFDLIKSFVTRNRQITCLSLNGTSVQERPLMEFFPTLAHDNLQILILPSGSKLVFSGSKEWMAATHVSKFPSSTRVEVRLSCGGTRDPEIPTFLALSITSMAGQAHGSICSSENGKNIAQLQELSLQRTITFSASPEPQYDKFTIGSIQSGMQTTVTFFNQKHTFINQHIASSTAFGCYLNIPPTLNQFSIKIPPKTDITYLVPILIAYILKKKSSL